MGDESQYQEKMGFIQKMGFDRPSWKKRFFVLKKNEVSYYSSEKDGKSGRGEKGRFFLDFLSRSKIKAVETGTILVNTNALSARNTKVTLKKPYLIQIGDCRWKEQDLRTFYVSCDTQQERDDWLKALTTNCEVYMNTDDGKKDRDKIPSDGARRDAFKAWEEEQKKLEARTREDKENKDKQMKHKAMREEPWYQVHTLCSKGTLEELKAAVEAQPEGIDIKLRNPNGGSTLLQAATYGNVEIMRYLIDQKIDINGSSNGGNTALHAAACMGFYDAAKLLLERGADRNLVNREGKTAAQSAKNDRIKELIENWGKDPS
jgi:hypothetical protein